MGGMPGGDVGQGAHRERRVTRHPTPVPRLGRQAREERHRGRAHRRELRDERIPGPVVRASGRGRRCLVEARQRRVEPAGEPEGPRSEEPLGVGDVADDVADDHWVNGKERGVDGAPGLTGTFENGVGMFTATDGDNRAVAYRGVWDRITPTSHRWRQGVSRDGGKTWDEGWLRDWVRA